jgi:chromosome segregation ATPase
MKLLITALLTICLAATTHAQTAITYDEIITQINDINTAKKGNPRVKEIIKEYSYKVGDDDSRNSARGKALNQVKTLILEEIGVFVESYLELNTIQDKTNRQYIREEIKITTAGILKTKILEEKYDGKVFYIKASVLVDPDSVSEGIIEVLKIRANQKEVTNLKALLKSKESELDMRSKETLALQKEISSNELINVALQKQNAVLKNQIRTLETQLKQQETEQNRLTGELATIQKKVQKAMSRVEYQTERACLMEIGMTYSEVRGAIGEPTSKSSNMYTNDTWHYGEAEIQFSAGMVSILSIGNVGSRFCGGTSHFLDSYYYKNCHCH